MNALQLTPHQEREVAVLAGCDPRTVRAYVDGKPQRSTIAARVEQALAKLGYLKAGKVR
jgi:DNA-binding LacI/PurR family transcriptional regulator